MTHPIEIPVGAIGVGSQPVEEDGAQLDILPLPTEMATFSVPLIPEPEEVAGLEAGKAFLEQVLVALRDSRAEAPATVLELGEMDAADRDLVDQVLGEGEVGAVLQGEQPVKIQESVLAGVWRVQYEATDGRVLRDTVEVGAIPRTLAGVATAALAEQITVDEVPPGVVNALPLVAELNDQLASAGTHAINLTLLPQSEADLAFLDRVLGSGNATILSRGYGNCRITSTGTRRVWWVQYFSSQDAMILNTLEVTDVPEVACASQEDLEDSAGRLEEILEVYR